MGFAGQLQDGGWSLVTIKSNHVIGGLELSALPDSTYGEGRRADKSPLTCPMI